MFKPEDEKLKAALEKKREEMMAKMGRLKILRDNPATGWQDFVAILDQYIDYCHAKKMSTKLDTATPKMIEELRFMDNFVSALQWVRNVPTQYINKAEAELDAIKRSEEQPDTQYV